MPLTHFDRHRLAAALAASMLALAGAATVAPARAAEQPTVIVLTQVACQFLESENDVHRGFTTRQKSDCDSINERTGTERLAEARVLELTPGSYVFRVTNKDVPYDLGFWVRGDGLVNRARLPSVSGGGLSTGATRDYEINLKAGDYVYSCPLNPTPDYKIIVRDN